MLDRLLGPAKSIVRVSVSMNFDQRETTNETYEPVADGKGVLTDQETSTETYAGAAGPGGVRIEPRGGTGGTAGGPVDNYEKTIRPDTSGQIEQVKSVVESRTRLGVMVVDESRQRPVGAPQRAVGGASRHGQGDRVDAWRCCPTTRPEEAGEEMAAALT
jgi:flagellar biosynthesis/type III secretory pathway M-ring protein FliF/YscJ